MNRHTRNICGAVLVACCAAACGGGGAPAGAPMAPPAAAAPVIAVAAPVREVLAGGTAVALTGTVSEGGGTVAWSLAAGSPGALSNPTGASVNYMPPAGNIAAPAIATVIASVGGVSRSVELVVYPQPGEPGLRLIAGAAGRTGIRDGAGQQASFAHIGDIAADAHGNYYVSDSDDEGRAIRKVSADGSVTTVARYADADLNEFAISAVAAATNGAVYVLDQSGDERRVRRIGADGKPVTLLRGASVSRASRLLAAPGGAIYVVSWHSIRKLDQAGRLTLVAGNEADGDNGGGIQPVDGQGVAAHFSFIASAGVDGAGNLLVLDSAKLRRVDADGTVTTLEPRYAGDDATPAVVDIAGAPDGTFHVLANVDTARPGYTVYRLDAAGQASIVQATIANTANAPKHVVTGSDGRLVLAWPAEIRQLAGQAGAGTVDFAGQQALSNVVADGPAALARFSQPLLLAPDRFGNLYVADQPDAPAATAGGPRQLQGLYLRKIGVDGKVSTPVADPAFLRISGIVADRAGDIYVSEGQPRRLHATPSGGAIYKVSPAGAVTLLAGTREPSPAMADGPGAQARFKDPVVAGVDEAGSIYVRDEGAYRKVAADGTTSTVAALPDGMGVAPDGYRYAIADSTVVRIAANGGTTVVAGTAGQNGTVLGALPGGLWRPEAVVPMGPHVLAVISGEAIVKVVLPH